MTGLLLITVFPLPDTLLAFELWLVKAVGRVPLLDFSSELMSGAGCPTSCLSSLCPNFLCMIAFGADSGDDNDA